MLYNSHRALELLRLGTNLSNADFHPSQEEAIRGLVEGKGRLLVVQKTGWGKSLVYFIAIKLLREQNQGPAILISPLLALMRNQIAAAEKIGVRAVSMTSENRDDWEAIQAKISDDEVDILLISPERLNNELFQKEVLPAVAGRVSLLVVDEAHCISDWGHDFRPDYRRVERIIKLMPRNLRVLATTATANNRVMADLQQALGENLLVLRGELGRPTLLLQTMKIESQAERMAWMATHIPSIAGSGIIYTLTQRDAEQVAEWLRYNSIEAQAYHSSLLPQTTIELEDALLANRLKVLVATTKLGMGYDKPDLAFVIHYQTPGSVVGYYQQVGRAGRNLPHNVAGAYGVLLSGKEETEINDFFINSAFPSRLEVEQVLDALEMAPEGLSIIELTEKVNISQGRIAKALQLLSLETASPIVKVGSKWRITTTELSEEFWARAERLTNLRRAEQEQMQRYVALQDGHMKFLIEALDGNADDQSPPPLRPLTLYTDPNLVLDAQAFVKRASLSLETRKQWTVGVREILAVKAKIPENMQARPGKILCTWGDAGWGAMVKEGKYKLNKFSDELVEACAEMLKTWAPVPAPAWVTCIPSRHHPHLVPDFAKRLADALGLGFYPVLQKIADRPPQKQMANSPQQALNVLGSIGVNGTVLPGPVLLVDDMVDSRWTLTYAAYLLIQNGSGPVHPLALASTLNAENHD